jgi:AbiV family abortive infection protein
MNQPTQSREQSKVKFTRRMNLLKLYSACISNAGNLLDEAKLLLDHKRFSRAAFLAYCAYEETGKAQIVADFYHGDLEEPVFRQYYFAHPIKAAYLNREVHLPENLNSEAWTIVVDKSKGTARRQLREPALYVEFSDDFSPIEPESQVNEEVARDVVQQVYRAWHRILEMDYLTEGIGSRGHFK